MSFKYAITSFADEKEGDCAGFKQGNREGSDYRKGIL